MDLEKQLSMFIEESVTETFSTMLSIDLKKVNEENKSANEAMLCSFIGFTGQLDGTVTVFTKEKTARNIVGKMLGMELEDDAEGAQGAQDGIGEVVNMIAGGIKNRLTTTDFPINIGIPTTLMGESLNINISEKHSVIEVIFSGEDIELRIVLIYKLSQKLPPKQNEDGQAQKPAANALDKLSQMMANPDS